MNNVITVWSLVAACALLLGLMYGLVWLMDRKSYSSLAFSVLSLSLVGLVATELGMMLSATAQEWATWVRWLHIPAFILVVGIAIFVRLYLRAGRVWMVWIIVAARTIVVAINFTVQPNFNFERVDSIRHMSFLGETVAVIGDVVVRPWQWLGTASMLLLVIFLADASITLWRRGSREARQRAMLIGGATVAASASAFLYTQFSVWGGVKLPAILSPPFLILIAAMAIEMSRDTLRATRLARELQESEKRLDFAAAAAGLGLWTWDARGNRIWASTRVRAILGLGGEESLEVERLHALIHPDDRAHVHEVLRRAAEADEVKDAHFRVCPPDGETRWIAARGRSEVDGQGRITLIQGVLRDVTHEFRAQQENQELRRDLAHVGRVTALGTLSSSLAHELSQPLTAIQINTDVAELLLQKPLPDLVELRQVLAEIGRDDRRAAEIIGRLRSLLRRGDLEFGDVSVDGLLQETTLLLRSNAQQRDVVLECHTDSGTPMIRGDKVHLSQVLINLVINAMDAIADLPAARRKVTMRGHGTEPGWVQLTVSDQGSGIPSEVIHKVFEPFFTTKASGMGMGLSVSRTIVEAGGGRIWAANNSDCGATFGVVLPAAS